MAFVLLLVSRPEVAARRCVLVCLQCIEARVGVELGDDPFADSRGVGFEEADDALLAAQGMIAQIPLTTEEREIAEAVFERIEAGAARNERE